jgi:hypothetical protein
MLKQAAAAGESQDMGEDDDHMDQAKKVEMPG